MKRNIATLLLFASVLSASGFSLFGPKPGGPRGEPPPRGKARVMEVKIGAVLPLSVELRGEYGLEGVHCGVPCAVGREGVMGISELPLTEAEAAALFRSAGVIERHIRLADDIVRGL